MIKRVYLWKTRIVHIVNLNFLPHPHRLKQSNKERPLTAYSDTFPLLEIQISLEFQIQGGTLDNFRKFSPFSWALFEHPVC